jgi:hypothetical protein
MFKIKYILPKWSPFLGIALIKWVLFKKGSQDRIKEKHVTHELIHLVQQKEMYYIPFFLWYFVEFVVRFVLYLGNFVKAYENISFEREAYINQDNPYYLEKRGKFNWWNYITNNWKK